MPKVDFRYLKDFISEEEFTAKAKKAEEAHRTLLTKTGAGNDFTGFVELPEEYNPSNTDFNPVRPLSDF